MRDWTVEMKAEDGSSCSISWILIYRSSLSGYDATDYHLACDGMGKCVVVVKAANGRIAAAYNEDGFTSVFGSRSPNLNGFIVSVAEDGESGEIFHRNKEVDGIWNHPDDGPEFGNYANFDLSISHDSSETYSWSKLGTSYGGRGPGLNKTALFGQNYSRVSDYEVFKIVIE
jgi:hypothetical protein